MTTGFTGTCPCCNEGYVEETTCDSCKREFCTECGGVKTGTLSTGVLACTCKPITMQELINKAKQPHDRAPE